MSGRVVVLTGGVGGAKLVRGLTQIMEPSRITAVINTGDDFRHLGMWISPDIDTLLYTLAGKADRDKGWGRADESWGFMAAARSLGMDDWFQLGDGDLALHVDRTSRLARGESLQAITARHAMAWTVGCEMLPMSNDSAPTRVVTDEGILDFQDYFVRRRCAPVVHSIDLSVASAARALPAALERLADPNTDAIIIAPSNPYLSIDPILAMPALQSALRSAAAPVVAVSPLIGGKAVKGPTSKIMAEMSIPATNAAIVDHYAEFLDAILIDVADINSARKFCYAATDILMHDDVTRAKVAKAIVKLAAETRINKAVNCR